MKMIRQETIHKKAINKVVTVYQRTLECDKEGAEFGMADCNITWFKHKDFEQSERFYLYKDDSILDVWRGNLRYPTEENHLIQMPDLSSLSELDLVHCYMGPYTTGWIHKLTDPHRYLTTRCMNDAVGFDNKDYQLDKVIEKLKTLDWVFNPEIEHIPYYNRDEGRTRHIVMEFIPPQELIDTLAAKIPKTEKYPSCRLKDYFRHYAYGADPFGIAEFLKDKAREIYESAKEKYNGTIS